ncbi:PREDICTED: uncharacterized protein LOC109219768 [Nicotiana attenuata]|uniref:uncharacterized protein LOC109219768 n=1 Tax=Nicotiana attenuata TaxID=49451 RepID=UPI0009051148|nr:PREDICTED: uncharacterized protein LOC109219768 [Nicotiana attenuata]
MPLNDTLRVVSDQLEILIVWNKYDLFIPVDFVTPNLRTFTYIGGEIITDFAPIDASKIRETRIELSSSKTSNVDWFVKLRSYIAKFSKDTVLCLSIYEMAWFHLHNTDDLGIHLPCPIKKLKLHICQSLPQNHCKSLLDCLLWTSHPEILEFDSNINFELVLRKELDYMVTEQHCCKATLVHRCWRLFLTDFKIVRSNSTKRNEPKYFTILFTW